MASLFLVTIGPVQEFIASARRSRDLWFGSWLLSELSRTAAKYLSSDEVGGKLVFPGSPAKLGDTNVDVVNRIMLELPDSVQAAMVGAGVTRAIQQQFVTIRDNTFTKIPGLRDATIRSNAEKQADELIEIYWAAAPFEGDYQAQRKTLEAALAARKNTRNFSKPAYSADVPKSSIDGQRESVIPEAMYPNRRDTASERKTKIERLYIQFGAGQAERLSGVDLLKRHGNQKAEEADFPSTSHFAALPFLERMQGNGALESAVEAYIRALSSLGPKPQRLDKRFHQIALFGAYDASLVFESRLAEEFDPADLQEARGALADFFKATAGSQRPEPYYALLHADGDNMGKVIDHLASEGVERHRDFSTKLDGFASSVRKTVEDTHHGALVYAGGDDVLAFLPLDTALKCAVELANQFRSEMAEFAYGASANRIAPTLSAGLVICHHIEPLSDALNLARRAEKEAKKLEGKDALCIILSKRSGADTVIKGRWQDGFVTRLTEATKLHQYETLPDAAAYDLRDLDVRLTYGNNKPDQTMLAKEAMRILKRKRGKRGEAELPQDFLDAVEKALTNGLSTRALADELVVAREFARAKGIQKEPAV